MIEAAEPEGTFSEIVSGARYVSRIPWLWVTIVLFGVVLMLQLAPQLVLMPKLVTTQWHRGIGAYALLTTLMGVGTVTGALLFGQIRPRRRRGVISYWFWLLNSLAVVGIALSPWYPVAGVLMLLRGICVGFGVAIWETMLMELVPENLLSRVVSLDYFGSFGLMPVGLAFAAAVDRPRRPVDADRRRGRAEHDHARGRADPALAACGRLSWPLPEACACAAPAGVTSVVASLSAGALPPRSVRACRYAARVISPRAYRSSSTASVPLGRFDR